MIRRVANYSTHADDNRGVAADTEGLCLITSEGAEIDGSRSARGRLGAFTLCMAMRETKKERCQNEAQRRRSQTAANWRQHAAKKLLSHVPPLWRSALVVGKACRLKKLPSLA
jgi:hypothetical protein